MKIIYLNSLRGFLLILILSAPSLTQAQLYELFRPDTYRGENEEALLYRFLEPSVQKDEVLPLIIFLHGAGERGDNNQAQLVHVLSNFVSIKMRNQYPCYILAPQCPKNAWWTPGQRQDDGSFAWSETPSSLEKTIIELVDQLVKEKNIDPDRIYLMGLSMGGIGTWEMAAHYPDRFAALAPICGAGDPSQAAKIKDIPSWIFHGADDPVISPEQSRQMVMALKKLGAHPIYTEFEGVKHNSWDYAFDENPFVYDWLFSQRKNP